MADRVGLEPTHPLKDLLFSRQLPLGRLGLPICLEKIHPEGLEPSTSRFVIWRSNPIELRVREKWNEMEDLNFSAYPTRSFMPTA